MKFTDQRLELEKVLGGNRLRETHSVCALLHGALACTLYIYVRVSLQRGQDSGKVPSRRERASREGVGRITGHTVM